MEDKRKINMLPHYAYALASAKHIYKDIDLYYEPEKTMLYSLAKENREYDGYLCGSASILFQEYYRKLLGLMEAAISENKEIEEKYSDIILKLFQKAYKKLYRAIHGFSGFKDFIQWTKTQGYSDEDFFNVAYALHFFIGNGNMIDPSQFSDVNKLVQMCYSMNQFYMEGEKRITNTIPKEFEAEVIELEKQLLPQSKDLLQDFQINTHGDHATAYSFLWDQEGFNLASILENIKIGKAEIRQAVYAFYMGEVTSQLENVPYEMDLKTFVIGSLHIKGLLRAYREGKTLYFANNKETMYVHVAKAQEERDAALTAAREAQLRYESLKQAQDGAREELLKANQKLQKELELMRKKAEMTDSLQFELNQLREFAYQSTLEEDFQTSSVDLSGKDILILGGHQNWHNLLKERYPDCNWHFIGVNVSKLNADTLLGHDIVAIFTGYLSHKLYAPAIQVLREKGIKYGYVSRTNPEMTMIELEKLM